MFVQVSNTLLLELIQLPLPLKNVLLGLSLAEVAIFRNILLRLLFILAYAPFSSLHVFFRLDFGLDIETLFEIVDLLVVCSSDFHTLLEILLLFPQPLLVFGVLMHCLLLLFMLLGSVGHWNSEAFVKMGFMWLFIVLLIHVVFVLDVPVVGAVSMLIASVPFVLMEIVEYFGV